MSRPWIAVHRALPLKDRYDRDDDDDDDVEQNEGVDVDYDDDSDYCCWDEENSLLLKQLHCSDSQFHENFLVVKSCCYCAMMKCFRGNVGFDDIQKNFVVGAAAVFDDDSVDERWYFGCCYYFHCCETLLKRIVAVTDVDLKIDNTDQRSHRVEEESPLEEPSLSSFHQSENQSAASCCCYYCCCNSDVDSNYYCCSLVVRVLQAHLGSLSHFPCSD